MESKQAQEAYWQANVLAWRASGQTQRADGVEQELNPHGLRDWPWLDLVSVGSRFFLIRCLGKTHPAFIFGGVPGDHDWLGLG